MRLLCLLFPRLPMQLALRQRPALEGRPLALLRGAGDRAPVVAVSPSAAACGVVAGMTAGDARRRCRGAAFLPANEGACIDELERLARIIRVRATPLVAIGGHDHLFIDLRGTEALYGAEREAAAGLARLAGSWTGVRVRAGVASSRRDAMASARAAKFAPAVDPAPEDPAEPGIPAFMDECLAAALVLGPSVATAGDRLERTLIRLQTILAARGQAFREATLVLDGHGVPPAARVRFDAPQETASGVAEALAAQLPAGALAGAASARLELRRLCPAATAGPARATPASRAAPRIRGRQLLLRGG